MTLSKAGQHRRRVGRIEGRVGRVDPIDVRTQVRATTTAIYVSTSINSATGDAQVDDPLHRWSVKLSYLREIRRIARVRRAVRIDFEVHSDEERKKQCQWR
jgi:hypothetical protein